MAKVLVRAEGVNFAATVFDTNDLSTIRGASLALLRMDGLIRASLETKFGKTNVSEVFAGASQAAYEVTGDHPDLADAARAAVNAALRDGRAVDGATSPPINAVLPHMTIMVDTAPVMPAPKGGDPTEAALLAAEAANKARQFRSWTVDAQAVNPTAEDMDYLDGRRPGVQRIDLPKDKVLVPTAMTAPMAKSDSVRVSHATERRRAFGRDQRQRFYRAELGVDAFKTLFGIDELTPVVNEVRHLVEDAGRDIPIALQNKIAVVYADGNLFGKARDKVGAKEFSEKLKPMRRDLLRRLLAWMLAGVNEPGYMEKFGVATKEDRSRFGLRLETLLWGGDEMAFTMPAWLAYPFVVKFIEATDMWAPIGGEKLSHAFAITIADRKTPLRQLRAIAHDAADIAKNAGLRGEDSLTIDIFESNVPSEGESSVITEARMEQFGRPAINPDNHADPRRLELKLAFKAGEIAALSDKMAMLTGKGGAGEGFPRSQIYGALRAARRAVREANGGKGDPAGLTGEFANDAVKKHFGAYRKRADSEQSMGLLYAHFKIDKDTAEAGWGPTALEIAQIARLWDYIYPFDFALEKIGAAESGR